MNTNKKNLSQKTQTLLGVIISVIAIPIIILNVSLILKTITNSGTVPDFAGYFPLVTLTDSMSPEIYGGDLMILKKIDGTNAEVDDVISFYDPDSKRRAITTHRIIEKHWMEDGIYYKTKGDANSVADETMVKADDVFGVVINNIPKMGHVVLFVQSTSGIVLLIIFPLCAFVLYDAGRKYLEISSIKKENEDLKKKVIELEDALANAQKESLNIYTEPRIGENINQNYDGGD